jgi:hypothetical protein
VQHERNVEVDMNQTLQGSSEQFSRALGEAVVKIWGRLPHNVQRTLFEETITFGGESIRSELAAFLHEKHPRTTESIKARAMREPDSLGG